MSTIHNNTPTTPDRRLGAFLKITHVLLLIFLAGGLLLVVPASAQSTEAANTKTGSVLGTAVDLSDDPVSDAAVVLQGPGDRLAAVTKEDGSFAFPNVTPGIVYQVTVTAEGFADWSSSITVEPGQGKTLADIKLRILAVQRAVTVSYSEKEVAAQEFKAEEQQRIFRFIPNPYVVYEPHPEPLTTKMKFELAYKDLTHPVFFARTAAWAGVQQANDTPKYRQGARGYGERFGAGLADATSENLFGNAILPSLLHQDPRYFYQGTGTKWSRARHAILAPFVCKGDNGALQPNYSTWGGSLIASSISMAYLPDSNRGPGHVFRNFGIGMSLHVVSSVAQEFILSKFTSRGKH
ncbi:MAG: carboxypeptidase-like regulatory domain-containing protein [Terriglobales bacterium]